MMTNARWTAVPAVALLVASAGLAQQGTQPHNQPGQNQPRQSQPGQTQPGQPGHDLDRDHMKDRPLVGERAMAGQNPWGMVARGGDVIGATIVDNTDENIGSISDLVIDPKSGHVTYAIVSHGGFLGIGSQQVAVPWQLIESRPDADRTYQIGMAKDRLEQAPSFEDDQWPLLTSPGWFDSTDQFFGTTPTRDSTRGSGGWGMQGRMQEKWEKGEATTIMGTISNIDRESPEEGVGEGLVVTVQTADGQERLVHLGPSWYLEGQLAELQEGQQVSIEAREIPADGRVVVLAQSVRFDSGTLALRDQQGRPTWDAMRNDSGGIFAAPEDRDNEDRDDGFQPFRDPAQPNQQPGQQPGTEPGMQPGTEPGQQPGTEPGMRPGHQPGMHDRDRPGAGLGQQQGDAQQQGDTFVRASVMRGKNIRNWDQEDIGNVNELAIDVKTGRIPFVIAGFGGFLGMGEEHVVLPWQALTFLVSEDMFMLAASEDQLRTAPKLDAGDLARLEDGAFRQEVYSHFGMDPSFANYESESMPGMDQRRAWGAEGQIQQHFQQGEEIEIRGNVTNVSRGEVLPGTAQAVIVQVRDDQGEEHTVKLGPSWFLERQDMTLQVGQTISIDGRKVELNGETFILAQSARTEQAGLWFRDDQGRPRWDALQPGDRQLGIEEPADDLDLPGQRPGEDDEPVLPPGNQPGNEPGTLPPGR